MGEKNMYENKKILVLGAAKSGIAICKLLAGRNNDITLSDIKELKEDDRRELENLGIKLVIGENQVSLINESWDLIVKNPAIMYTSELVTKINSKKIRLENEMEIAYHFLPEDITIIGVTGSNGKTTTTTIIYELLKRMKKNVVLGGNIGTPLAELVSKVESKSILLLEISDHQLVDFQDFKTDISVLTNVCPTHLDYHGTYDHYKNTKKNIFNHHSGNSIAIINKKDRDSLEITESILSQKIYFNDNDIYFDETGIYIHQKRILDLCDIKLKGIHNYENILSALLVVERFGLDEKIIKDFFQEFGGVEHRLEYVRNVNDVLFYNDSKATNPTATITALKTFKKPILLILGGMERNQDFNELNDYLGYVKEIFAIGTVTKRVKAYADERKISCHECYTLKSALEEIVTYMKSGDVVLLSTASASQDQYQKFEDRGNEFKNFVAKL